jgi:hypothetical protein
MCTEKQLNLIGGEIYPAAMTIGIMALKATDVALFSQVAVLCHCSPELKGFRMYFWNRYFPWRERMYPPPTFMIF